MTRVQYHHPDIVAFAAFLAEQRGRLGFYSGVQCALVALQRELASAPLCEALRRTAERFPPHRETERNALQRFSAWCYATGRINYLWTLSRRSHHGAASVGAAS